MDERPGNTPNDDDVPAPSLEEVDDLPTGKTTRDEPDDEDVPQPSLDEVQELAMGSTARDEPDVR